MLPLFIPFAIDEDVGVCDKFQSSYFKALEEKKVNTDAKLLNKYHFNNHQR